MTTPYVLVGGEGLPGDQFIEKDEVSGGSSGATYYKGKSFFAPLYPMGNNIFQNNVNYFD